MEGDTPPPTIDKIMNIPISIQVVTVVSSETGVNYQQVYINNEDAAQADFDRQKVIHKDLLLEGWSVSLRRY